MCSRIAIILLLKIACMRCDARAHLSVARTHHGMTKYYTKNNLHNLPTHFYEVSYISVGLMEHEMR